MNLDRHLRSYNSWMQVYLTASEKLLQEPGQLSLRIDPQLQLIMEIGDNSRRVNLSVADEDGCVFPGHGRD